MWLAGGEAEAAEGSGMVLGRRSAVSRAPGPLPSGWCSLGAGELLAVPRHAPLEALARALRVVAAQG